MGPLDKSFPGSFGTCCQKKSEEEEEGWKAKAKASLLLKCPDVKEGECFQAGSKLTSPRSLNDKMRRNIA